jgi:hypothetical protein
MPTEKEKTRLSIPAPENATRILKIGQKVKWVVDECKIGIIQTVAVSGSDMNYLVSCAGNQLWAYDFEIEPID